MDEENESALRDEIQSLEAWLDAPVTLWLLSEIRLAEESLTNFVLETKIDSIETFISQQQGLGHLRGLRAPAQEVRKRIALLKEQLQNL